MGLGKFFANAGRAIGSVTKPISRTIEGLADKIKKIPILGQVFDYATISLNIQSHLINAAASAAQGQRIDKAALAGLKKVGGEYQKLAKYTQAVVSFVPGVGSGVAGALAAGVALSDGKPISKAVVEGIKGSVPGGPLAQSAFSIAQGAIEGKPIDQIAINALPIPPQAKQGLATALAISRDIAAGKRVDKALVKRVDDITKLLGPQIAKAVNIGSAVGIARKIQSGLGKEISSTAAKSGLADIGKNIAKADRLIGTARNIGKTGDYKKGFDIATGLMNGKKVNQSLIHAARKSLNPAQKKAFDTATALHIGRKRSFGKSMKVAKNISSQVGYLTTAGLVGAADHQKMGIMRDLVTGPNGRIGAAAAIKDIANERDKRTFWQIFKKVMFGINT